MGAAAGAGAAALPVEVEVLTERAALEFERGALSLRCCCCCCSTCAGGGADEAALASPASNSESPWPLLVTEGARCDSVLVQEEVKQQCVQRILLVGGVPPGAQSARVWTRPSACVRGWQSRAAQLARGPRVGPSGAQSCHERHREACPSWDPDRGARL